jgi:hypothetical protein
MVWLCKDTPLRQCSKPLELFLYRDTQVVDGFIGRSVPFFTTHRSVLFFFEGRNTVLPTCDTSINIQNSVILSTQTARRAAKFHSLSSARQLCVTNCRYFAHMSKRCKRQWPRRAASS